MFEPLVAGREASVRFRTPVACIICGRLGLLLAKPPEHAMRATDAPLRLRGFRPREHWSIPRAQRCIRTPPNNHALCPKRQNFLRTLQLGRRVWANSHNHSPPVVEHARVRFVEIRRPLSFALADRKSFSNAKPNIGNWVVYCLVRRPITVSSMINVSDEIVNNFNRPWLR